MKHLETGVCVVHHTFSSLPFDGPVETERLSSTRSHGRIFGPIDTEGLLSLPSMVQLILRHFRARVHVAMVESLVQVDTERFSSPRSHGRIFGPIDTESRILPHIE